MKTISLSDLENANGGGQEAEKAEAPAPAPKPMSPKEHVERVARNLVETAVSLVSGDRNDDYDHPFNNMERTAASWATVMGHPVTGGQVALGMIGVKLARESYQHKADNLVDIIGWVIVYEAWRQVATGDVQAGG